jgi:excisionase family DNA binding protein
MSLTEATPLAVSPKEACRLLSIGNTRLYQLVNSGELESYRDGRVRRITMASIEERVARLLASNATNMPTTVPEKRKRGRPHRTPEGAR